MLAAFLAVVQLAAAAPPVYTRAQAVRLLPPAVAFPQPLAVDANGWTWLSGDSLAVRGELSTELEAALARLVKRRRRDLEKLSPAAMIALVPCDREAREAHVMIRGPELPARFALSEARAELKRRRDSWTRRIPFLGGKANPRRMNLDKQLDAVVDVALLLTSAD